MDDFIDSHYLSLPSQGNIYLSTKLQKLDGSVKMLVACLRRQIYLVEYQHFDNFLEPITKEIYFAYISGNAEMSSMDAFSRSKTVDDIVIGIAIKNSDPDTKAYYLNIYSDYEQENSADTSLETIPLSCESLVLDYLPYGLHHVQISPHRINGTYENLWLLPGSDCKIHAYRGFYGDRCHSEIPINEFFPEFEDVNQIVLCLAVFYYNDFHNRISCLGCENGFVRCCILDCDTSTIVRYLENEYENPISSIQLFTLQMPKISLDEFIQNNDVVITEKNPEVNLLITNTLYHSEVFMDILKHDLKNRHCLHESDDYDACLCSLIADIDFDGDKEIILGTFGEELLLFKYTGNIWKFVGHKSVSNPVHKLFYYDMTNDGVCELIVITTQGLHIYQHKLKSVHEIVLSRLKQLESQKFSLTNH